MAYSTLESCLIDLEKTNQLVRIKEEVDSRLEMAAIHLKVQEAGGPALLFERIKNCSYRAASNIFGTLERSRFIFRHTLPKVQKIIAAKEDPMSLVRRPFQHAGLLPSLWHALPWKVATGKASALQPTDIVSLPQIYHWPQDGGAFITLPQVYSEDPEKSGPLHANLGMYRIQLNGNEYITNKEVGMHYQIHRGIGVHQYKAAQKGQPLKVSIFVGGPPAHTLAAVMPLPEGLSELAFAGMLAGRRFRYTYQDGYCISTDADFVICGELHQGQVKPEGPFGDHLGYYSLTHNFPVLQVKKVLAKKNAIWPFTVVGRPPQEDTAFGDLIHELTGKAIPAEIPGLKEVHAVDAAGVHPLLLAIGSERYTPYEKKSRPAELLTIANHILGTGQLSLAKYLWITADETNRLTTHHIPEFFQFILSRVNWERDLHFQTQTTMDTLDYSGSGLNQGSKVVIAAYGNPIRELTTTVPSWVNSITHWHNPQMVLPGVLALQGKKYENETIEQEEISRLLSQCMSIRATDCPLIILCDDSQFTASDIANFLWVTFTRSDPAKDIHGVDSFVKDKHWGCRGPLIIDARIKPHHAPPLELDPAVVKKAERLFNKGGSLYGILP